MTRDERRLLALVRVKQRKKAGGLMLSVVNLNNPPQSAPNVICALENLLRKAKTGEILSLAYITVELGGFVGTGFETSLSYKHAHHMVAGAVYLLKRLEQNALDGRDK